MYHEIKQAYEDEFLKISYIDGISDTHVTISFSSSPRINEQFAKEEFINTSTEDSNAIFIIDKTNSFGNHFDWNTLLATIQPLIGGRQAKAVGFCLGGFLAIVLSKHIELDSVVAITPQYSVLPEYMLDESFMLEMYTYKIKEFKIPSLDGHFMDRTQYYIFENNEPDDVVQRQWFPWERDNVHLLNFGDDFGHGIAGQLGEYMDPCVRACWNHNPDYVSNFIKDYYEGKIKILYGAD